MLTGLMEIRVKILGYDKSIKLDVEASDTIASIKSRIYRDTLIPLRNMRLLYGNANELEDSSQLSANNIGNGTWLKLAVKSPEDKSTRIGCDNCQLGYFPDREDPKLYLCVDCAANDAIRGEFDPTDYDPPKKKQRR